MIFTTLLEKQSHQDLGIKNIPYIEAETCIPDLSRIESVRKSFDAEGEEEDFCCLITMHSGQQHSVKVPFDEFIKLLNK